MTGGLWYVVVFSLVIGPTMPIFWIGAVAAGKVPEIAAGKKEIWFHIAAEVLTGVVLVAGGIATRVAPANPIAVVVSSLGLGLLLYSVTVSPGYYVDRREWPIVAVFSTIWLGAIVGIAFRLAA